MTGLANLDDVLERARRSSVPYGLALLGLGAGAGERRRAPRGGGDAGEGRAVDGRRRRGGSWHARSAAGFLRRRTPEATAYAVKFLSKQRPQSPLLPKAALWLMNHRNEGY